LLTTTVLLTGAASTVLAQDGAYIVEPWLGRYEAVRIQPVDQKIVAGATANWTPAGTIVIARYNSFGNPDTTFGSGGLATFGSYWEIGSLTLQPDGKVVVTEKIGNDFRLNRLTADGFPDAGFGSGGSTAVVSIQAGSDYPDAVALQSTGKIVVAGQSNRYTTNPYYPSGFVARFTASGALDSGKGAFGDTVKGSAVGYALALFSTSYTDLAVQPDDKLIAVGGTDLGLVLARYTAAGTLDNTFNGKGYSVLAPAGLNLGARAVALQPDGKIVVAGTGTGIDGYADMVVARFNANGTLDTGFAGGSGYVLLDIGGTVQPTTEFGEGVAIQPDGKIVVAGTESFNISGAPRNVLVARFNANGTLDGTFGAGGFKLGSPLPGTGSHSFWGRAVALQSDGSIIVAGVDFQGPDGNSNHPLLMRFDP
jgi:uncharacterized delta-60 repeat protein